MLNGGDRLAHFFPSSFGQPEMPPDAGHDGRESAPATIPVCHVFPAPKPSCPTFVRRDNGRQDNGRQDRLEVNAAGGTPATASHARMTMTVTGLPSRRQESRASPFSQLRRPFDFPVARCAILYISSFSFPPLQVYANVPMPPFQTASVVIFVAGAKVIPGLYAAARSGCQRLPGKISTLAGSGSILSGKPCIP